MKLFIRVDASTQIGTGHVMRCLALAQAWQDAGGQVIFVMATEVPDLITRLKAERMEVIYLPIEIGSAEDAEEIAKMARHFDANWVVVDGYHFGAKYQEIIKESELKLLFIDDYGHAKQYHADIVLNQNIHACEGLYRNRQPYTKLLLGTSYSLLRREFWQWRGWQRSLPLIAKKLLVTLGGADPDNVTLKVIQGLQQVEIEGLEAVVVVGGSNPHYEQLRSASQESRFTIHLKRNVTDMSDLMSWADVAVTPGGSTCWELAFMGLPSVMVILADNQRAIAEKLEAMGVVVNLGWHENVSAVEIAAAVTQLLITAERREKMTRCSQELVDGQGSSRVLCYLKDNFFQLRSVQQDDCRLLWEWSNAPEVRALSFSSKSILWENHVQWFKSKLINPNCIFYIAINNNNVPIGQIRYDIENYEATVSMSIDPTFRNQGYGSSLIKLACKQIFSDYNITRINAYIKPSNHASVKAFSKAGFKSMGITTLQGNQAILLIIDKCKFD
ncbi:MAG: UDP-2,4-diacetamido-2,4,6-trideoxy-beta-L-altropyranose hydrolase [Nostoc sp. DedQUE08]|uniref:UDP-2,4-diacetamido-2,4, 6-trideoxy-beta-L-altropyranose hydrolase n=1 Tax=unclassified Nostoc TaxID=2593658 RepID=UPI002AD487FC|nr:MULTISPECIES: UDP-2,4-diacetamido-2,4,6-trideoxy-beta-L-altropyranose hydrolase [unclassified Nostoc]MDZ8065609.1 UDP-2,4-diacetamido-2,4,6-trideoxy-beta-L-altropyranose hydrolase [Nostoc sp. DedQUE08]MDZ8091373.1 UDP-2,4-diacetamido-2,4,6-trideoxy-beta-L-altropyranose hydrolase [Nostoc sp. DedQUE05]